MFGCRYSAGFKTSSLAKNPTLFQIIVSTTVLSFDCMFDLQTCFVSSNKMVLFLSNDHFFSFLILVADHHHLLDHTKQPCKEEFSDWPHGLLAIGTLGNKMKQEADQKANLHQIVPSSQDHVNYLHGLTAEEVGKLQKELNLIFQEHGTTSPANLQAPSLPFDRFLDADSSTVEDGERVCSGCSDCSNSNTRKDDHHLLYCNSSLVQSRGKDMCSGNSKAAIGKKSLSFLLKKMFVCRSGFSPTPISSRDPAVIESRMEKVLNTDTLISTLNTTS